MKKILIILICTVVSVTLLSAQEVSEKKEIAVFSLSHVDWTVPSGALSLVDQQVTGTFTDIGRFDVKGLDLRLEADDVSEFVELIRDVKEANMQIDEKYRLGEETFTEADFERLTGSFLIVIPSLTFYDSLVSESDDGPEWEVSLQTSFSIIKVNDSSTLAQFSIDTYGSGKTQKEATMNAASAISSQLDYELRTIEEFKLKTGIIEVMPGGRVILELGSGMGLQKGDEFSIVNSRLLDSGHTISDITGLLVISDVKDDLSYGQVVYNDQNVLPGDQLSEIPRAGADLSFYLRGFLDTENTAAPLSGGSIGLKSVLARGSFDIRPFLTAEIPIVDGTLSNIWPGLPLAVQIGGEFFWYFGRLQLEPSISVGGTGLIPIQDDESFILTHVGGTAALTVNWMLTDTLRLFVEGGYSPWISIAPDWLSGIVDDFGGIFAGAGVTLKM